MSTQLSVWVDGCCNKNGSGWAVIIPSQKIIYRGDVPGFTNQKAELSAVIQAVHRFGHNLHIITDSRYVMGCFTEWYHRWLRNGWRNANGKSVENKQLIDLGLQLGVQRATFEHVDGHSGNIYNDMADYYSKHKYLKSEHIEWTLIQG